MYPSHEMRKLTALTSHSSSSSSSSTATASEIKSHFNVTGFNHDLATVPAYRAASVNIAVHLRMLFTTFETPYVKDASNVTISHMEEQEWLNSHNGKLVFYELSRKIKYIMETSWDQILEREDRQRSQSRNSNGDAPVDAESAIDYMVGSGSLGGRHQLNGGGGVVYITCDNPTIKEAFVHYLLHSNETMHLRLTYAYLNMTEIYNSGRVHIHTNSTKAIESDMFDTAYDWYVFATALSAIGYRQSDSMVLNRTFDMGSSPDSSYRVSGRLFSHKPYYNLQIDPKKNNVITWYPMLC